MEFISILRSLVVASRCVLAAILCDCATAATAAEPLRFQFAIPVGDYPVTLAWSPDGRYLAVALFNATKVVLLDVERREVVDRNIRWKITPPKIVWSPDSRLLALVGHDIQLISTTDGRQLASASIQRARCTANPGGPAAFTADGNFLWVSCGSRRQLQTFKAAYRYDVPTLAISREVNVAVPAPGLENTTFSDRMIESEGKVLLSSLIQSCPAGRVPPDSNPCSYFTVCIDLQAHSPCFSPLKLETSNIERWPRDIRFLVSKNLVVSRWTPRMAQIRNGPSDFAFEVHDVDGNRLRRFGLHDERSDLDVDDFDVASDGRVFAAVTDLTRKGGVAVWDSATGKLLQMLPTRPAQWPRLSPDGRRLAVGTRSEVRIYSVSNF
jgi:WD40 repeat protein